MRTPALILLLALALRTWAPGLAEFKYDEAQAFNRARAVAAGGMLPPIGAQSSVGVPQPPLHVWVLSLPARLSPDPRVAVLFMGFLGTLAVAITYRAAGELFGRRAAWAAPLLLAVSPWFVLFNRKLWVHLLVALSALLIWLAWRARRRPAGLAGFLAAAGGQLASNLTAVLQLPAIVLSLVQARPSWRWPWVVAGVLAGLVPLGPYLAHLARTRAWRALETAGGDAPGLWERLAHGAQLQWWALAAQRLGFLVEPPGLLAPLGALAGLLTAVALGAGALTLLVRLGREAGRPAALQALGWALLPIATLALLPVPPRQHYAIALVPGAFLLASGLVSAGRRAGALAAGGAAGAQLAITLLTLAALAGGAQTEGFGRPLGEWTALREALQGELPGPAVRLGLSAGGTEPGLEEGPALLQAVLDPVASLGFLGHNGIPGVLLQAGEPAYLLDLEGTAVNQPLLAALLHPIARLDGWDAVLYRAGPPRASDAEGGGDLPRLIEVELEHEVGGLRMYALWALPGPRAGDWKFYHHLVDAGGSKVGQRDGVSLPSEQWRQGDILAQSVEIPIESGIRPGTYTLLVGLYSGQSGEVAQGPDGSTVLYSAPVRID